MFSETRFQRVKCFLFISRSLIFVDNTFSTDQSTHWKSPESHTCKSQSYIFVTTFHFVKPRLIWHPGFVHFLRPKIQGLFKDFQGPNFEISRTSFLFTSKNLPKEIVWQYNSCSFSVTKMRENNAKALVTILDPTARRVCNDMSGWLFLLKSCGSEKIQELSRTRNEEQRFSRTFKALKMYSQNSRVFKGFQDAYESWTPKLAWTSPSNVRRFYSSMGNPPERGELRVWIFMVAWENIDFLAELTVGRRLIHWIKISSLWTTGARSPMPDDITHRWEPPPPPPNPLNGKKT